MSAAVHTESRSSLQRGEYGLWMYDTVKKRLGKVKESDFKRMRGREDNEDTLDLVAEKLAEVTKVSALVRLSPGRLLHSKRVRTYTNSLASFAMGEFNRHINEGLKTGFAFPANTIRALIEASEGSKQPELAIRKPSDALGKVWFDVMLQQCARTGNGYWGAQSSEPARHNHIAHNWMRISSITGKDGEPFLLNEDGDPALSEQKKKTLAKFLVGANIDGVERPYKKTSGCPMNHETYKMSDSYIRGYVGSHQKLYRGENMSPVVEVEFSGIQLCTDALYQAYSLVTGIDYAPEQKPAY